MCSDSGTPVTITGNPTQSGLAAGCYLYKLTGTDRVGNTSTLSSTVEIDKTAPERHHQRADVRQRPGGGDLLGERRRARV